MINIKNVEEKKMLQEKEDELFALCFNKSEEKY